MHFYEAKENKINILLKNILSSIKIQNGILPFHVAHCDSIQFNYDMESHEKFMLINNHLYLNIGLNCIVKKKVDLIRDANDHIRLSVLPV